MRWVSAVSEATRLDDAVAEACQRASDALDASADLVIVFPSRHFAADFERVPGLVRGSFADATLMGCSAGAVIGGGHEVENRAGFALLAAHLPGVDLAPFHIEEDDLPDMDSSPRAWHELVGVAAEAAPSFIVLSDPFSIRTDHFLKGVDYAYPRSRTVGGLASGADRPGANALYLDDRLWGVGLVGLALSGNVEVSTVVAQGCRPIGKPHRVTSCRGNLIFQLDDKPAVTVLREMFEELDESDQELAQTALHVGILTDELAPEFGPGDFLIRNLAGVDTNRNIIAVGEYLRDGQTIQFHLRDAQSAADEIDHMLVRYVANRSTDRDHAALLFSCLGRGEHLYGRPDHDTTVFRKRLGDLPVAGFFCNGEIGPVGQATYLHGFTSAFAIFSPRD